MRATAQRIIAAAAALACLLGVSAQVAFAQDQPQMASWAEDFWVGGFDDSVSVSVIDGDGTLFVGGEFTAYNGERMNHIARWDGQSWSPLGEGLDGPVWSLAIDADGSLVVGGYFKQAGDVVAPAIARWDGEQWSGFSGGLGTGESAVSDIEFGEFGELVVALVLEAYDEPYRGFYRTDVQVSSWDGFEWTFLGEPRSITQTDTRPALAVDDAGVLLSSAGSNLSAWNGTSWGEVGSDQPVFTWVIKSLRSTRSGQVLVVDNSNTIHQWLAGQWSEFAKLEVEGVRPTDIVVTPNGSTYLVAEDVLPATPVRNQVFALDGQQWVLRGEVSGGEVSSLGWFDDQLLAVGSFNKAVGSAGAFLALLTDSGSPAEQSWSSLGVGTGAGLDGTVHDIVVDKNGDTFVAGDFFRAGGVEVNGVAKWDGQQWSGLGEGTNGTITALAIDSQGDLIAGGYFSEAGGVPTGDIARWDGIAWTPIGTGFARRPDFSLRRNVEALVTGKSGTIYASGYFEATGSEVAVNGIAKWNGTSWQAVGAGLEGLVSSLALGPDGSLVVSGSFSSGVARWDGLSWSPLGSRFVRFDPITDVVVKPDGTIVAAGSFDGNFGVAFWSGIDWVRLGTPVLDDLFRPAFELPWDVDDLQDVYTLEIDSAGGVIAGGRFLNAGGQIVNHLARWDGRAWQGYGEGLDGAVTALAFGPDDELIVGGRFVNAGGRPASRLTTLQGWRVPVVGLISEASTIDEIVNATNYDPEVHGDVLRLYQAFFHREPDVDGAKYWIGLNGDGYEIDAISKFFEATDEFSNNYAGASNEVFLGVIYLNVLGRTHDANGFEYWLDLLDTGQLTRGDVVRWIAANTEFINRFPYGLAA